MSDAVRIPMLRDHHTHPLLYAALLEQGVDLGFDPAEPRERAVARLRERAAVAGGGWTIGYGWNSGRYALSKVEFDDLPPLVVFNLSLHGLIVNDAGRALIARGDAPVAEHLDDQHWIERNLNRVLNGFARDGATPERIAGFYDWLLAEHGVAGADEMLLVDGEEIALFERAGLLGRARFWAAPELFESLAPAVRERVHGIKLFTDGALGARTAALHAPYRDAAGGGAGAGMLMYERAELERLLAWCRATARPVAVHAIGDRAIDQLVDAAGAIGGWAPGAIRVEHAQLVSGATARRIKALGIHLCMQPNFSDDSIHYAERLPDGYPERNNPFRMLIDRAGFVPGEDLWFGSDGMPHGVREGLRQALFPPHEGQALTLEEFVAGYGETAGGPGHIEVRVDRARRRVDCRVVTAAADGAPR